nr:hypothetical protein pmam_82 [Pithovirus mammoth]
MEAPSLSSPDQNSESKAKVSQNEAEVGNSDSKTNPSPSPIETNRVLPSVSTRSHPLSPRDGTPVSVGGEEIDITSLPPIRQPSSRPPSERRSPVAKSPSLRSSPVRKLTPISPPPLDPGKSLPATSPRLQVSRNSVKELPPSFHSRKTSPVPSPQETQSLRVNQNSKPSRPVVFSEREVQGVPRTIVVRRSQVSTSPKSTRVVSPKSSTRVISQEKRALSPLVRSPTPQIGPSPTRQSPKRPDFISPVSSPVAYVKTPTRTPPLSATRNSQVAVSTRQVNSPGRVLISSRSPSITHQSIKGAGVFHSDSERPTHTLEEVYDEIGETEVDEEERFIRVIRAAPKGFLNIPVIPDYSLFSEVQQAAIRAKFDMNLAVIHKTHPGIPKFEKDEPLHIIHVKYDRYVRQIYTEKTVIKYKLYLTVFFLIIEALGTRVLGLPVAGFTKDQLDQMIFYDQLLLEMGEKSTSGIGEEWPVEIRIIFFAMVQAVIFILVNVLASFIDPSMIKGIRYQINEMIIGGNKPPPVDSDGIAIPPPQGGLDLSSIVGTLGSLFAAGGAPKPAARPIDGRAGPPNLD